MKTLIANSIRWWEPRRLYYNMALTAYVLLRFYQGYPRTRQALFFENYLMLFGLAVLANVAYCFAYVPDLFVQLGGHDEALPKVRWAILFLGIGFAMVLTHFWSLALLGM